MTISYSQVEKVNCNHCGREFDGTIWLIVDTKERPDLVEKLKEEELHLANCFHCGKKLKMDIPLLIYNHGKRHRIIFSPQENTSEKENQQILDSLLRVLSENLEGKFKKEWIEDVEIIPKIILPPFLPDPKKTEIKSKTEHEQENDIRITELEMLLLQKFLETETMEEKYLFLNMHPDFIIDRTIKIFDEFIELSSKEGDQKNVKKLRKDLELLKDCQSIGINQAFEDYDNHDSDDNEDIEDPYALFEEAQKLADQYMETPNIDLLTKQMEIYSHLFNLYAEDVLPISLTPATILANFGINATERYSYTERVEDLNGAITALEGAVDLTKETDPVYGDLLKRLGHAYGLRSNHLRSIEDSRLSKKYLKEAEEYKKE